MASQNMQGKEIESAKALVGKYHAVKREVAKVIVGQEEIIDQLMIALLARDSQRHFSFARSRMCLICSSAEFSSHRI
jgi:hypothetical protein